MTVKSIQTSNFRNLSDFQNIELDPKINILHGNNGSGKTSFLEALFALNTGRSFRTQKLESIISHAAQESGLSKDSFTLFGNVSDTADDQNDTPSFKTLGIQKSRSEKQSIKIDGEVVASSSILAKISPTLLLEPSNATLLLNSSQARRKFIDWGVFHVEHSFNDHLKHYNHCIKQRNSLLKQSGTPNAYTMNQSVLDVWESRAAHYGQLVDSLRRTFYDRFVQLLSEEIEAFEEISVSDIKLSYRCGWDKQLSLAEALKNSRDKDLERGYSSVGPHRMDVRIRNGSLPANETLSRGQQKMLIVAMYITQVVSLQGFTNKIPLVLIDDLEAELDSGNAIKVLDRVVKLPTQLVATCLDPTRIKEYLGQEQNYNMFHVEHGKINRVQ